MSSLVNTWLYNLLTLWGQLQQDSLVIARLLPMLLLFELPLFFLVISGILRWFQQRYLHPEPATTYCPSVSCIITCYAEGEAIRQTIDTLVEQCYSGPIEIIAVIDGAVQNRDTYAVGLQAARDYRHHPTRRVRLLPKWQRGGRVSTLNTGLAFARGEIIINADADTSFDNDAVAEIVRHFADPNVPAVGGALRVRNHENGLIGRLQALEYLISMLGGKTGLGQWNLLNNISGAFGAFRRDFLTQIGGWDTHTAEDLDLTVRIKQYFARHPHMKLPFACRAIGHTDAPPDWSTLVKQRLRWDGDLLFLYLRKHWPAFTPRLLGWKTFAFTLCYGVLQNVLLPFLVLLFSVWLLLNYPPPYLLSLASLLYLVYLGCSSLLYALVVGAISERPGEDLQLIWALPLYPLYTLWLRLLCAFALLNELLRRSHEESSMAPWWVLLRGHRF